MLRLAEDRRKLAADHLPLARSIARRFGLRRGWRRNRHEFLSVASLTLVTSARDFDESRGRFATFARWRIVGELGKLPRPPMVADPERLDTLPSPARPVGAEVEAEDGARAILARLPIKAATACKLTILDGLSQAESGRRMGCSPSEVARQVRLARRLLQEIA